MFSNFLKSLSILKKFLFINLVIFLIIGFLTALYISNAKPNLIKNKTSKHIQIINNTIEHILRLNIKFEEEDIRRFLFSTRFLFQNLDRVILFDNQFNLVGDTDTLDLDPRAFSNKMDIVQLEILNEDVSKKIIELIYDSGLPREWCTYLVCENETTAKLAQSPLLGYISFIGSSKIGWNIKAKIAPGVKIALEHGGNAPTIVRADANLKLAIPQIAKAGFYHAGQVCVSAQRIYVHDTICDSFVAQINRLAQTQKLGNPLSVETEIGPLISDTSLNRINKWVQDAIDEGATLIAGGNKLQNNCYEPTILLNPLEKSKVTKEEIFGPVICIYSFSSDEEAIKRANNSRYCFQSAVFTESLNKALKYTQDLNGSTVLINSHPAFRVDWMPFGGQGLSGDGLGGISYSTEEMLKQKLIIIAEN